MANQRRSVEKEAYWRGQFARQSASGLSIRSWCRENGVSEPTYYVWRRELRKRDHERGLTERDRHEPLSEAAVPPGFVAVDVLNSDMVTSDAVTSDAVTSDAVTSDMVTSDAVTSDAVLAGREAKLEIDVAGGIVIRLREDASAETLERVLSVVCRHGVAGIAREVGSC